MTERQLDCKIARTWNTMCAVAPDATTPVIMRSVARHIGVSYTRVWDGLGRTCAEDVGERDYLRQRYAI